VNIRRGCRRIFSTRRLLFLSASLRKKLEKMASVAAAGGSGSSGSGGGGRKRPHCLGGPSFGCDCPDCRAWRRREIDNLTKLRISRRKKLMEAEKKYSENRPHRFKGQDPPGPRLKTAVRVVMGRAPEIRPVNISRSDSPPNFFPREYMEEEGGSRWIIGHKPTDGRRGWAEVLALDEFNAGYINRLHNEHSEPQQLADLMDTFCRDGLRLTDVLTILGNTCLFLRLVGNRTTARDLITVRQLDLAYSIEHPDLELAHHPLNDDNSETEHVALGIPVIPDPDILPEFEDDEDVGNDD
jgi:hypothetical protein